MEIQSLSRQPSLESIPKNWSTAKMGEILVSGNLGGNYANEDKLSSYPLMKMGNLDRGRINLDKVEYIPEGAPPEPSHRLKHGDILFNTRNTPELVGKVAIWRGELPQAYYNSNLMRLEFHLHKIASNEFANYALNSNYVLGQIRKMVTATTSVAAIYRRDLDRVTLALPPLPEQRAIADVLSDVDALIEQLDALIAKKRAVKTATMQRLLTGEQRLPGFGEPWETRRLGEVGNFSKGKGIPKKDTTQSGIPCVRYAELYTHHRDIIREYVSFIPRSVAANACRLKKGDLLFAGSGETKEEIGMCAAFLDDHEAYAGGDIVILSPDSEDPRFLGYALNAPAAIEQKSSMAQGDAVVHLYARHLSELEVPLPPVDEQRAIANILSDMDAEIEALEARREKTQRLKQGMMQELLTGRTRLV